MAKSVATHKRFQTPAAAVEREISHENKPDSPVVQSLQRQVANSFVLYSNYKHYHWQTFGPLFRDLHKLFDELAKDVLDSIDVLAERVRMIGQDPPGQLNEVLEVASVAGSGRYDHVREMIEEANRNALIVIGEMREGARIADEHSDPGTVDVFSRLVQIHERHEWWLRDLLRTHDGLAS